MKKNYLIRAMFIAVAMISTTALMSCDKNDPAPEKPTTPVTPVTPNNPTTVAVTEIKLNKTQLDLTVGDKETLVATVSPDNATNKTVAFTSSNTAAATVNSTTGEVTAVAEGATTISAKAGDKTVTCGVSVKNKVVVAALEVKLTGTISHTTHTKGQKGTVEFSRFPATVDEFKQVREKIGTEPHGVVALQLMAYEMYRRDTKIGEECIKLVNTTTNVNVPISRLKELFGKDANYARPYLVASFLKGAIPENGYNPTKPYTVEVKVNDSRPYQATSIFQSTVLYLDVLTTGTDSGLRTVEVLTTAKPGEPGENKYYIVMNAPGLYTQPKEISFTNPWKGLD
jgi:hypothetical protein